MVGEEPIALKRKKRWHVFVVGLLMLLGLGFLLTRVALPPLATSVLKRLLYQQDWDAVDFRVTGGSPSHIRLADVALADGSWQFTAEQVILRFGLDVASSQQLRSVTVIGGHWIQDLNPAPTEQEPPSEEPSTEENPPALARSLPVDQIHATDLTLQLQRDGQEVTLTGDIQLADGWQDLAQWSAAFEHPNAQMTISGNLKSSLKVGGASLQATLANAQDWLGWIDPANLPEPLDMQSIATAPIQVQADWLDGQIRQWVVQSASLQATYADTRLHVSNLEVTDKEEEGDWVTKAMGTLQQAQWQEWVAEQGQWSWENQLGKQAFTAQGMHLRHGESLNAKIEVMGSQSEGRLEITGRWTEGHAFHQELVDGLATITKQEDAVPWLVSCPLLASKHPQAFGQLVDTTITLWPKASADEVFAKAQGAIKVPEHRLPMPFSAGVTRKTSQRWESDLSVNLSSDTPTAPRQFYWNGLAFTINGVVDGQWSFQADQQHPIEMSASLGAVEVRRNESALTLQEVTLSGSYPLITGNLQLQGRGKSGGQDFTMAIDANLAPNEAERHIYYHIKNLNVAENTLLGAFAEAMKEMPIAATMHADGTLRFPKDGPIDHQLTLQLREGRYRHPERKLLAQGLEGIFAIQSFSPFVTAEDQQARFTKWRAGPLTLSKGQFRYKLGPRGAVMIKQAEAEGLGGKLLLDSLGYYPGHPEFLSTLTFEHIELAQLATLIPKFTGDVSGRVSGKVYLRLKDGVLSLPKGRLTLDEGSPAHLHLDAKKALGVQLQALSQDPGTLSIVEEAMKDLVIKDLNIGFFDPEANEQDCRIRIEGHSRKEVAIPNSNGGKAIAPIHLNINVDDPSQIVRHLLNLGLRKQFDTNR